jgi:uncharacterized protein (DUF1800 family)
VKAKRVFSEQPEAVSTKAKCAMNRLIPRRQNAGPGIAPRNLPLALATVMFTALLAACSGNNQDTPASASPKLLAQTIAVTGTTTFPQVRSSYSVTQTAAGYVVTDLSGVGGTVTVNTRFLQFADIKVDLAMGTVAADVTQANLNSLIELYVAYFNRVPDAEGMAYWIGQLQAGQTLAQIGTVFYNTALLYPALTGYSPTMSDADFVAIIYKNVLGRSSVDAGGLAYWTGALAKGTETRASLISTILGAAHGMKGDATYGWVSSLLDNKVAAANYFAIGQGVTYLDPNVSISRTMAIAAAITPTDIASATKLADAVFGSTGPTAMTSSMTDTQAARLLLQAQFSASDAEIATVRAKGPAVWLNEQMNAAPGISAVSWLDSRGYNAINSDTRYYNSSVVADRMAWNQLMASPDAVRKRAALALSEMMVVSITGVSSYWTSYAMASYWDVLSTNAFGNFHKLLNDVTLNVATGYYLNTLGNQKENSSGRQPDENFAREVMQLYTIGLYQLNLDGTEQLDASGNKIETYGAADVSSLAHVFTGYQAPLDTGTSTIVAGDNNANVPTTAVVTQPMRLVASQHSTLAVNFIGTTIPANTEGSAALKIALDALFNHPNVGPFFARQMIQRLVTSNPSPAYVARVATVFNNNGSGVRGDLKAVFSAILLDSEARSDAGITQSGFGKLREPMVRLVQWGRTFADLATRDSWKISDLSDPATELSESPLHSPTVFNFFRPGYIPPSTAIATAGQVAPEFQVVNESTIGGYMNYMQTAIRSGFYQSSSDSSGLVSGTVTSGYIPATYANELAMVTDAAGLVARLNRLLCAGRLSAASQTLIVNALNATTVTAASTASAKLDRIGLAVFLVMATPEYLVQK